MRGVFMAAGRDVEKVTNVQLCDVSFDDLQTFFEMQLDPIANRMAAFTAKNPSDRNAFDVHWNKILNDKTIVKRTIVFDGQLAGNILSWEHNGTREICYWIAQKFWGKGIATNALLTMLTELTTRPLYARAAKDNLASIRVL